MGWLSWNTVQGDISEEAVRQAADFFDKSGLKEYGWDCIIMDDLWHADKRASDGKPLPNPQRFPNGVKAAADYVHAKGMKFGLYTDAADYTCGGAFGSYGYEEIDANEYAKWGVDFVKCDYCGAPGDVESAKERYKALGDALQNSGRNMILCICEWGPREPWKWGAEVGGSCWRTTYDVRDCWTPTSPAGVGVLQSIDGMKSLSSWQGVNRFNDADMLCLGLHGTGKPSNAYTDGNGMTMDEYRTQYARCMWSSPMALSFDPRKELRAADMAIITNRELIALNQDKMGQQADLVLEQDNVQLYAKDLENGDVALAVVNLGDKAAKFTIDFSQVPALYADTTYTCRDLWAQAAMDDVKGKMATTVKSHATMVFRLSPKYLPTGIGSPLSDKGFDVKAAGDGVSISCPGTAGLEKRVIVSDMGGRVVASTTSRDEEISLTLPAPRGIYAVSVTCGAQATARKVMF